MIQLNDAEKSLQNNNDNFSYYMQEQAKRNEPEVKEEIPKKVVIHQVTLDDTLEGLSLQYGVSPNLIKEYNGLTSDSIYYVKTLKIPNPQDFYQSDNSGQEDTLKGFKILFFTSHILEADDKSDKIARYYLDSNNWNTEDATKEYQSDLAFEKKDKTIKKIPQTFRQKVKVDIELNPLLKSGQDKTKYE